MDHLEIKQDGIRILYMMGMVVLARRKWSKFSNSRSLDTHIFDRVSLYVYST